MSNRIVCPDNYKCTKLHRETERVCCPLPEQIAVTQESSSRQQTSGFLAVCLFSMLFVKTIAYFIFLFSVRIFARFFGTHGRY